MAKASSRRRAAPYTSDTLAGSRRMIAPGPLHEQQVIIYDIQRRAKSLASSIPYYDRTTGKPIAEEVRRLREHAQSRIDKLPDEKLRQILTRGNWEY